MSSPPLLACSAAPFLLLTACGGSGSGGSSGGDATVTGDFKVFAANDLGMRCIDRDFSALGILPPFNVVNAQVVERTTGGAPRLLGSADIDVSYAAHADAGGSVDSTSLAGKTNFWDHVAALFGAQLTPGTGLTGLRMPDDAEPDSFRATKTPAAPLLLGRWSG